MYTHIINMCTYIHIQYKSHTVHIFITANKYVYIHTHTIQTTYNKWMPRLPLSAIHVYFMLYIYRKVCVQLINVYTYNKYVYIHTHTIQKRHTCILHEYISVYTSTVTHLYTDKYTYKQAHTIQITYDERTQTPPLMSAINR